MYFLIQGELGISRLICSTSGQSIQYSSNNLNPWSKLVSNIIMVTYSSYAVHCALLVSLIWPFRIKLDMPPKTEKGWINNNNNNSNSNNNNTLHFFNAMSISQLAQSALQRKIYNIHMYQSRTKHFIHETVLKCSQRDPVQQQRKQYHINIG